MKKNFIFIFLEIKINEKNITKNSYVHGCSIFYFYKGSFKGLGWERLYKMIQETLVSAGWLM